MKSIENYLERRSRLSNEGSQFTCPESCPRYGCKDPGLHVPSTLIDLVLQSAVLKSCPSHIYDRFYKIGWSPEGEIPWVGHLTLELQKPCGFLKGKWCGIYPGRPIGCAEFPEAWIQRGLQGWIEDKERFRLYPCLEGQRPIPAEREAVLAELSEMAAQERWVSDFCLFGQSPFYVDLRNLVGDLTDMAHDLGMLPEKTDSTAPQRIPYPLIESFIQGKLKETGFQKEISKKVTRLNRLEERVWLFELRETIGEIQKPLGTEGFVIYNQFEGKSLRGYRGVRPRHR